MEKLNKRDKKTAREAVRPTIRVIANMPKIFKSDFLLHIKNGRASTMHIARSLVFQRKPVGGLKFEYNKELSSLDKSIGSLPNKEAIEEYDEIGIRKLDEDSIREIKISAKKKNPSKVKSLSNFFMSEENVTIDNVIVRPQNM